MLEKGRGSVASLFYNRGIHKLVEPVSLILVEETGSFFVMVWKWFGENFLVAVVLFLSDEVSLKSEK